MGQRFFQKIKNCSRTVPVTVTRPSAPPLPPPSHQPPRRAFRRQDRADLLAWALWALWVDLFGVAARLDPPAERPPGFGQFGQSHWKSVFDFQSHCPKRLRIGAAICAGRKEGKRVLGHLGALGSGFPTAPIPYYFPHLTYMVTF